MPFLIRLKDDEPFAFAGLWDRWRHVDEAIESCTIIVTEPNEVLESIYVRMPVILPPDEYELWLDPEFDDTNKLQKMLRPFPADEMEAYQVRTLVNNLRNDKKECTEAVQAYTRLRSEVLIEFLGCYETCRSSYYFGQIGAILIRLPIRTTAQLDQADGNAVDSIA